MRRYLFIILLFFACSGAYAQSLSFEELLNLTNMTDAQSHDFLTTAKGFKESDAQTFNGRNYQEYKTVKGDADKPDKYETVLIGTEVKTTSGNVAHEIIYNTTDEQDLNNLLAQAKKSNLTLIFQGADQNSNIYRFDNSLFHASISIAFDKKSGNVDVQQK
jgi:hypothetical protein